MDLGGGPRVVVREGSELGCCLELGRNKRISGQKWERRKEWLAAINLKFDPRRFEIQS
jgi:hypothetical protein